jgi:hypothetical protein
MAPPFKSSRFKRRHDLTDRMRIYIAAAALYARMTGEWGRITELSRSFQISRTFVYMLSYTMISFGEIAFGDSHQSPSSESNRLTLQWMLSLRLEGHCSIEAISSIMKRFDIPNASVGSISQKLTDLGSRLSGTISAEEGEIKIVVFLSDEIFSKNRPILITVEPASSAILRIELAAARKAENWEHHWQCIGENGYLASYLVCDEGKGLCTAKDKALPDAVRQSDTFHAVAHQLGLWVERFEKAAYKAIELEYQCYEKLDSARSETVIENRIAEHEKAAAFARTKMELYESYRYMYRCLISELHVFGEDGRLLDRADAENNIRAGLDLIESLQVSKLDKEVKKVRRTLPNLLNYFDAARDVLQRLENTMNIERNALHALCLAWQWNKGSVKSKKAGRTRHCKKNEMHCLEFAQGHLQENYDFVKERVFKELDTIVQSSALVECINSIIRPYLNGSKNQISQETLNLIMFYHNHRRYRAGKRKGKTPMEILTGEKQKKDWISLLLD